MKDAEPCYENPLKGSKWPCKPLGDVCEVKRGSTITKKSAVPGGIPVVAGGISPAYYHNTPNRPANVITVSGSGANAGYVNFFDVPIWASDCSTVLPKTEDLDVNYVHRYLLAIQPFIFKELARGAAQPHVYPRDLARLPIPLPPSEEQLRIVAVLDEAFEGLARARAHAEANLQNARELFENFLAGKMASESDDWAIFSFGDSNVLKIVDGDRGANYPKKTDFLSEGHCLFLNTKNVRPDGFNFDETMFISEERDQLLRKGKLLPRDVLLTTRGTIGNVAIFDDAVPYEHIRINSGMLILRPNEDIIRAEFLFELLRSAVIKEQIEEHVSGAAQPQLPIRSLVKFKLPAPKSIKEQLQIVEQLKQLSDKVSDMLESYEKKIQNLNDLHQSILQKAFAGELT